MTAAVLSARRVWVVLAAWLVLLPPPCWAGAVEMLSGHVPAGVAAMQPLRRMEGTNVLRLAIGLPLRQQGRLEKFLQDLYDPSSPSYRRYLEPAEFTVQFGPSAEDYRAVEAFAVTNHLVVTAEHANRMVVDVQGSVADVEKALQVKLQVYAHPTEDREFFAPEAEPQVALGAPVLHIAGLDNYQLPRSYAHEVTTARGGNRPIPQGGSASGNYAGKDFRAAYAPGITNTGTGQTVGLVEFAGYMASDIMRYESNFSLPNVTLTNVLLDGLQLSDNDTGVETPLDIELTIAMAPGLSQVVVYYGAIADDILSTIAKANVAKQISSSWTYGIDPTTLQLFQQLAAQGQTYINCAGDGSAYTTYVPAPVDAAYITCVGGTTLSTTAPGGAFVSETAWNEGNGSGSGGGVSLTYPIPLWQQGVSMDANGGSVFMRNFPDVAMVADNVWAIYDGGSSGAFGGTSCPAPLWGAFTALVNQQAAANGQRPVGFLNPALYALARSGSYSTYFHDTTTGNNTNANSPNKYFATRGYDLCTGLGSPRGQGLIPSLAASPVNSLVITPASGVAMSGVQGGPFAPASNAFTLFNFGGGSNGWSVANTSSWFSVSPSSGVLGPGASNRVTVTLTAAAANLPAGYYAATLVFTNWTNFLSSRRTVTLVVGTGLIWDSSAGGGPPVDGSGTWAEVSSGNGDTNWYSVNGDHFWSNATPDLAVFGAGNGMGGTVSLGSAITAAGLNFATLSNGSYTIAGGGYTLTLTGNIVASNTATVSAPVALGEPVEFSVAADQAFNLSGILSGGASNSLTVTGPGTVNLTGQNNTGLSSGMAGAVVVNSGRLSLNGGGSTYGALGNAAGITINAGAIMVLLGSNDISGTSGIAQNITLNGGTLNDRGLNQSIGTLTLNGGAVFGTGSLAAGSFNLEGDCYVSTNFTVAAQNITTSAASTFWVNSTATLTISGTITGAGGVNFTGPGAIVFTAANAYTGPSTISGGSFQVIGALGNSVVTVSGGALGGSGVINGPATVESTGTLITSPDSIANLTFNGGLTLLAGSSTLLKVSAAQRTNDQLVVAGTLAQGGILVVSNTAGSLTAGESFTLINASNVTGFFAGISPSAPGVDLVWNTNWLGREGILLVEAAAPAALSGALLNGSNLVLSASGGPPYSHFHVVAATNVALPLTNWTPLWSNTFDGNGNGRPLTNALSPSAPQQFFEILIP